MTLDPARLSSAAARILALVFGSAFLGFLVVVRPAFALILIAAMLAGYVSLRARSRTVLVGVLVLAYMNAIPFVDLVEVRLPLGFRFDDVAMAAMIASGVVLTWGADRRSPAGVLRLTFLVFGAYWAVIVVYTVLSGGGTFVLSSLYGRDFLAIVMSLGVLATSSGRDDQERLIALLVGGACLYALAHILQFLLGLDTSFITHPYKIGEAVGTARIYSKAMALVIPTFMLALGRAVLLDDPIRRIWYSLASVVLAAEIIIEFTRANYVGMVVAFLAGAVLIVRTRSDSPRSRAAILLFSMSVLSAMVWMASGLPGFRRWVADSAVTARIVSTSADVASQGGTFGYRLALYRTTFEVVGGRWLSGVGFWHPAEHYVSLLPDGAIRNNDTGLLGVLATMGLVGVVLIVTPAVLALKWALEGLGSTEPWVRATSWSTTGYVVWTALTSFSLGFYSYGAGLASTAVIVGLMAGARTALLKPTSGLSGD